MTNTFHGDKTIKRHAFNAKSGLTFCGLATYNIPSSNLRLAKNLKSVQNCKKCVGFHV